MSRRIAMFLSGCAFAALAATHAFSAEKFVYANYMGEQYTLARADLWMMEELEKRSNGEITFEKYFNGTLLKAPDLFPGLEQDAADIVTGTPAAYNRNEYRLSNIVLPYISSDAVAVNAALGELVKNPEFLAEYESRNAKLLYVVPWAENTFWSGKPIGKIDDFKGLRVRAVQSIATVVEKMGGTPVTMAWPEAVEGLSRGVVDAVSSAPFDSAVLGSIYESARFGSDGGDMGIFSFAAVAMNQRRWEALSDEHKKLFAEVAAEVPAKFLEFLDEELQKAADKLCAYTGDLEVTPFSEAEVEVLRTGVGADLQKEWVGWAAETTQADTGKLLEQYVSLVREAEKTSDWKSGFDRYAECKK